MNQSISRPSQKLAVLGATGSIGDSTLELVRLHRDKYQIYALSGFHQVDKLFLLCQEFEPKLVCVASKYADEFQLKVNQKNLNVTVLSGAEGLVKIASADEVDMVVAAIVGAAGLPSTLVAARAGISLS